MLPLRSNATSESLPLVLYLIMLVNGAVWMFQFSLGEQMPVFIFQWGCIPRRLMSTITSGDPNPWVLATSVSHMFMHGSWDHIIGNMWMLFVFGKHLEDRMGHITFLVFYIVAGFAAAASHIAYQPASSVPMVGASGAISGVMGAYMVYAPRARVVTLVPLFVILELPAWLFLFHWFGFQLLDTFGMVMLGTSSGIAYLAHVGGFLMGLLWAFLVPDKGSDITPPRAPKKRPGLRDWEP